MQHFSKMMKKNHKQEEVIKKLPSNIGSIPHENYSIIKSKKPSSPHSVILCCFQESIHLTTSHVSKYSISLQFLNKRSCHQNQE
jgi:hypothetical protein